MSCALKWNDLLDFEEDWTTLERASLRFFSRLNFLCSLKGREAEVVKKGRYQSFMTWSNWEGRVVTSLRTKRRLRVKGRPTRRKRDREKVKKFLAVDEFASEKLRYLNVRL